MLEADARAAGRYLPEDQLAPAEVVLALAHRKLGQAEEVGALAAAAQLEPAQVDGGAVHHQGEWPVLHAQLDGRGDVEHALARIEEQVGAVVGRVARNRQALGQDRPLEVERGEGETALDVE